MARCIRLVAMAAAAALATLVPVAAGAGQQIPSEGRPWADRSLSPDARADMVLARMTQGEKFQMMAGACDPQGHTGRLTGIPRLSVPDIFLNDGPAGVHQEPPTAETLQPAGLCLTSNPGEVGKGGVTALPAPIALAATFDRSLALLYGSTVGDEARNKGNNVIFGPTINIMRVPQGGRTFEGYGEDPYLTSQMTVGWIDGLQSQGVIANVKHYLANNQENDRSTTNAVVDERTLHEIYMPGFEAAVKDARAGSVMAAYNRVNGTYMTENRPLLLGVLKQDWGFAGFVLSDYNAQHSTVAAANAGEDLEMPNAMNYDPRLLAAAVASGLVTQATIDDHVHRILRTMFAFGVFDEVAFPQHGVIDFAGHGVSARTIAEQGTVLLKNNAGLLPLDAGRLHSIALIGPEAIKLQRGGGSSAIVPDHYISPSQGIAERAGPAVAVHYDDGSDSKRAAAVASSSDVALVFAHDVEGEGQDRACIALECSPTDRDQDGLIAAVAAGNPRTVVVLNTGAPVLMPWVDQVPAVLDIWYPGEEGGRALARVLFGDVDPSGRLPATFPVHAADVPASSPLQYPGVAENAFYSEGVFVGYRHYDTRGITPLFPFGYGLSYTSFALRNLKVVPGALPGYATVETDVQNTGGRPGSEVVQLYVGDPGTAVPEPPRQLQGFAKLALQPGETGHVVMPLGPRAFAYWDATHHSWAVPPGCYGIMLGVSSRDIREQTTFGMGDASCAGASASEAQPAAPLQSVTPVVSSLPTTSASRTPASPWALLPLIVVALARITRRRTRGEAQPGR